MKTYVIGASGLIGSSLVKLGENSKPFPIKINWSDSSGVEAVFNHWIASEIPSSKINLVWAAGVSHVGSSSNQLAAEISNVKAFFSALKNAPELVRHLTYISSAGAIYGGYTTQDIDTNTPPNPISDYGRTRLQIEKMFQNWSNETGNPLVIARISNVYGPGQNPAKSQGLISALVVANLTRKPIQIYVPLDTLRDYIYVDDVARILQWWIKKSLTGNSHELAIICSRRTTSISELVQLVGKITGKKTPIILGASAETLLQPMQLAFKHSDYELNQEFLNQPLEIGIHQIYLEKLTQMSSLR